MHVAHATTLDGGLFDGTGLATYTSAMRVLEARFYPRQKQTQDFMVVGHVVWHGSSRRESPIVQPAAVVALGATPASILSKLQYLVTVTAKESFEGLQNLQSRFWSFVDVTPPLHEGGH